MVQNWEQELDERSSQFPDGDSQYLLTKKEKKK